MKLKNGKQVYDLLQQLPVQVEVKIMRNALAQGVKVLRDEARLQVSDTTETGALRKAIKTTRDTRRKTGQVVAKVKLKGRHSYLGLYMEYGVRPHVISVVDGEGSLKIGNNFVGAEVMHPGFIAKPFLRPALDSKAGAAIDAVGAYIAKYVTFGSIQAPTISVDEEE